jgi:hypothetical protein
MKSFLLRDNHPTIRWSMLEDNVFYEGAIPEGYDLAVCPSGSLVVLDVDVKNGKNGFEHIPKSILNELEKSFNYLTRSGGRHYWLNYLGNETLKNTSTEYGLDLRRGKVGQNNGGYVKFVHTEDIRNCLHLINPTSKRLNLWLEGLFGFYKKE